MTGDWMGTLTDAAFDLRLLVHIRQSADGTLNGSMDNLDLGRMDISIENVVYRKTAFGFDAPGVDGSYQGRLDSTRQTISGIWRMGEDATPLVLSRVTPSRIDGVWTGALLYRDLRLRLVFYIGNSPAGLIATMKSPDQSDSIFPVGSAMLAGSALILDMPAICARFEGTMAADLGAIEGIFTQGGRDLPLTLKRLLQEESTPVRPQEPCPPFPYREKEVSYRNRGANLRLAGTLTIPEGCGPFPAVLLIAGSGPLDRDETMYSHRPFRILADYLSRRGIAVLRADKRGVGESGGDGSVATTADYAQDARAGVAYLRSCPEVDCKRVGLVGHSEGGLIACILASRYRDLAFVVLLAAPGLPGWELACRQSRRQAELYGVDTDEQSGRPGMPWGYCEPVWMTLCFAANSRRCCRNCPSNIETRT